MHKSVKRVFYPFLSADSGKLLTNTCKGKRINVHQYPEKHASIAHTIVIFTPKIM